MIIESPDSNEMFPVRATPSKSHRSHVHSLVDAQATPLSSIRSAWPSRNRGISGQTSPFQAGPWAAVHTAFAQNKGARELRVDRRGCNSTQSTEAESRCQPRISLFWSPREKNEAPSQKKSEGVGQKWRKSSLRIRIALPNPSGSTLLFFLSQTSSWRASHPDHPRCFRRSVRFTLLPLGTRRLLAVRPLDVGTDRSSQAEADARLATRTTPLLTRRKAGRAIRTALLWAEESLGTVPGHRWLAGPTAPVVAEQVP